MISNAEKNCRWHFADSLGGQDQGPNEAMGENFKKDKFESLVRESIQNSLDAVANPALPVLESFRFRTTDSNNYPNLFDIKDEIQGCIEKYPDDKARKKFQPMLDYLNRMQDGKFDFLEVSDENTTGMDYRKDNTKCRFYSFLKSSGNSSKNSTSSGGSFGFGKAAYFLVSKLRMLLVSSMTADGQVNFEGAVSLCTHKVDGKDKVPVGFYCDNDEEEPVDDITEVPVKFRRKTVGTSMFIMGLDMSDKEKGDALFTIIRAAVKHFWLAILNGKLEVTVGVGTDIKNDIRISKDNIVEMASNLFVPIDGKRGHTTPVPYIDAVLNAGADQKHLVFEDTIPYLGNVRFYLVKDKNGTDNVLYMRAPMMLVTYGKNRTSYGFYGVFVCEDKRGNKLLQMMENPAHSEWDPKNIDDDDTDKLEAVNAYKAMAEYIQAKVQSVFASSAKDYLTFGGLEDFLTIPTADDDLDGSEQENGKPNNDEAAEEDIGVQTTDIEGGKLSPVNPPIGQVVTKKHKKPTGDDEDSGLHGHSPEKPGKPEKPEESDKPEEPDIPEEPDKPGNQDKPEPPANDEPENPGGDVGQDMVTPLEPLRVTYRTFAQTGEDGIYHYLVIHSNRATNRAVISVYSGGDSSDDEFDIAETDNGSLLYDKGRDLHYKLINVHLQEGKTMIRVIFNDGIRHAIKLNIDED